MGSPWAAVAQEPARGARRTDDRRVISGVVPVLKTGCRWQDCPAVYGPSTTLYNRFRRWTMRGIWRRLFDALARADPGDGQAIDSTTAKAHRSAAGEKGGAGAGDWPLARRAHHENPRHRRRARTPHRHRSDAWPSRRRSCRDSANQRRSGRRAPGCRHRLRQRWSASLSSPTRHSSGSSRTIQPASDIIRSTRLPIANAISSSAWSAASRIGDASPHDTTSSQLTLPPPS